MEVGGPETWEMEILIPNSSSYRTPKSLPYLLPSNKPCPPEKPSLSPSAHHIKLEEKWRTYWVDNE